MEPRDQDDPPAGQQAQAAPDQSPSDSESSDSAAHKFLETRIPETAIFPGAGSPVAAAEAAAEAAAVAAAVGKRAATRSGQRRGPGASSPGSSPPGKAPARRDPSWVSSSPARRPGLLPRLEPRNPGPRARPPTAGGAGRGVQGIRLPGLLPDRALASAGSPPMSGSRQLGEGPKWLRTHGGRGAGPSGAPRWAAKTWDDPSAQWEPELQGQPPARRPGTARPSAAHGGHGKPKAGARAAQPPPWAPCQERRKARAAGPGSGRQSRREGWGCWTEHGQPPPAGGHHAGPAPAPATTPPSSPDLGGGGEWWGPPDDQGRLLQRPRRVTWRLDPETGDCPRCPLLEREIARLNHQIVDMQRVIDELRQLSLEACVPSRPHTPCPPEEDSP